MTCLTCESPWVSLTTNSNDLPNHVGRLQQGDWGLDVGIDGLLCHPVLDLDLTNIGGGERRPLMEEGKEDVTKAGVAHVYCPHDEARSGSCC